jgi:hypothetical protein
MLEMELQFAVSQGFVKENLPVEDPNAVERMGLNQ